MHKRSRWLGLVLLALGVTTFVRTLNIPRLEALHGSDIVQLTACGGLFAVGLVGLANYIAEPHCSNKPFVFSLMNIMWDVKSPLT